MQCCKETKFIFNAITLRFIFALSFCLFASQAAAINFSVNSTLDQPDINPGDGICSTTPDNNICTLRAAVMEGNALGSADIYLQAKSYYLSLSGVVGENSALTGDLDVIGDLKIFGKGKNKTIIDGRFADRIFEVFSDVSLFLFNMTLTHGAVDYGMEGGAIMNWGTLRLKKVRLLDNIVYEQGAGGAIASEGSVDICSSDFINNRTTAGIGGALSNRGHAEIVNTIFKNSSGGLLGGAIYNDIYLSGNKLIIRDSKFVDNYASGGADSTTGGGAIFHSGKGGLEIFNSKFLRNQSGWHGGALVISAAPHQVVSALLERVTFHGNSALAEGGGIAIVEYPGYFPTNVSIKYVTVSRNSALNGGGIYKNSQSAQFSQLSIVNSTISANQAKELGGGIYTLGNLDLGDSTVTLNKSHSLLGGVSGAGVYFSSNGAASVNILRSLIANNMVTAGSNSPDCYIHHSVDFNSLNYNLFGNIGSDCVFVEQANDQLGSLFAPIDPLLGPLANNGGFTMTHALLPGSPAIDAAGPASCGVANDDQRGQSRPVDGGSGVNECDIGAFEYSGL